jgi:zona occludens toxin
MIFLVTGTPGGGKTLNTLKFINEDDQFKNRPIYYFNIKDLTFDWFEITADEVRTWQALPDNSVIVVDEAQRVFPKRGNKVQTPQGVAELDTHRHRGFDFFFITQHPTLVDHDLRKFVGQHRHYERSFGMESARLLTWQKAQYNVDDYHIKQEAETTRIRFDKKYYNSYKSATDHNVKKRVPAKIWILGFLMVGVFSGIAYFASTFGQSPNAVFAKKAPNNGSSLNVLNNGNLDNLSYSERLIPRIPSIPSSAPIYDELTEPESFPRIAACVIITAKTGCQCYTQQATKIDVDIETCTSIVANGYFDSRVPDIRQYDIDRNRMPDRNDRSSPRSTNKNTQAVLIRKTSFN